MNIAQISRKNWDRVWVEGKNYQMTGKIQLKWKYLVVTGTEERRQEDLVVEWGSRGKYSKEEVNKEKAG